MTVMTMMIHAMIHTLTLQIKSVIQSPYNIIKFS